MRIVHLVIYKLLSLIVLATGVLLVMMYLKPVVLDQVRAFLNLHWTQIAPVGGALLFILGLLGLLPLSRKKRPSTISFRGDYGEVTIHLDSIEATLNRIVSKMPEVKKISVRLNPSEDGRRAEVTGSLWIYKGSEAQGASEIVSRVQKYLRDTAINILGVDEVVMGRLDVPGIIVSSSMPKPQAADAKAEKAAAPVPAPAPVTAVEEVPEKAVPAPMPEPEAPLPAITSYDEPVNVEEPEQDSTSFESISTSCDDDTPVSWGAGGGEEEKRNSDE